MEVIELIERNESKILEERGIASGSCHITAITPDDIGGVEISVQVRQTGRLARIIELNPGMVDDLRHQEVAR